mgnify:CR=1 FL=1
MAKRFIDTNLLKKKFIRECEAPDKLLFIFLFLHCNHAGIWDYDLGELFLYCGQQIDNDKFKKVLGKKVIFFDNDEKVFIPSFIKFQYNELQIKNPAHKNVIIELQKFGLIGEKLEVIQNQDEIKVSKELQRGFKAPMEEEEEKEMVKVKEENKNLKNKINELEEKLKSLNEINKFDYGFLEGSELKDIFLNWIEYKRQRTERYKTQQSVELCFKKLQKYSGNKKAIAEQIINDAMALNYSGFFELKINGKVNQIPNDIYKQENERLKQQAKIQNGII